MSFFNWFRERVGSILGSDNQPEPTRINPATGLPMIGGIGGTDVQGNPYGTDLHDHHHHSSPHDSWSSSPSSSDQDDWWRWGPSGTGSNFND
jgi:hypothetical protein